MKILYELNRNVTKAEAPWLERDYNEGEIVYYYPGYTYGCITPNGTGVSEQYNTTPFFELPTDALTEVKW